MTAKADVPSMARKGISLRLSVTESCQLRCTYCRAAEDGAECGEHRPPLDAGEMVTLVGALHAVVGIEKLRITGGEPLLYRGVAALIAACSERGIPEISLTTNGQRLAALAAPLRQSGLRRINISLDSLDPQTFARITRGGRLNATLAGIHAALDEGLKPVKLNTVVLRGLNDGECEDLLEFGLRTGCHVRFLELMPIGVASADFAERFVPTSEVRERLRDRYRLEELRGEPGGTSRDYLALDGHGRSTVCGFISPTSEPFCDGCNRLRLTHDGRLLGCLAHRDSVDLIPALRAACDGNARPLTEAVAHALSVKTRPRNLSNQRDMARIGG